MKSTKLRKTSKSPPANVLAWLGLLSQLDVLRAAVDDAPAGVVGCKRMLTQHLDDALDELLDMRPTTGGN